ACEIDNVRSAEPSQIGDLVFNEALSIDQPREPAIGRAHAVYPLHCIVAGSEPGTRETQGSRLWSCVAVEKRDRVCSDMPQRRIQVGRFAPTSFYPQYPYSPAATGEIPQFLLDGQINRCVVDED